MAEEKNKEEPKSTEAKEEAPAEEPKSTEAKEEAPAEEPKSTEAKEETPAEEPKSSEAKEETPAEEQIIDYLGKINSNMKIDSFSSGDTVIVNLLIREGERERIQSFQGNVIKGSHINGKKVFPGKSFTVRRISSGVGVERTIPMSSPFLDSLKVVRRGKVRQSRLYFLRSLTGKKARIKEAK
ncbi:MAG: 50S ribosomal protein L19 [Chloroflexi bacterium]|nr:50S ribosomal protein L19 [Chloroflexota bacterium]